MGFITTKNHHFLIFANHPKSKSQVTNSIYITYPPSQAAGCSIYEQIIFMEDTPFRWDSSDGSLKKSDG